MALNREEILRQYQAAAKIAEERAKTAAITTVGAKGFAESLQQKIARREVSPEATRREREVVSQIFGAPEEMRARLEETRLLPSEVGGLVGGRMQTYLDQLQSIRDSRSARQRGIDDIIKSAARGVEAQAELAEIEIDTLRDSRDEYWKQYSEAQRQYEFQVKQASQKEQKEKDFEKRIRVVNDLRAKFAGATVGTDGGYNPNVYTDARETWFQEFGTYANFEGYFPVTSYINVEDSPNAMANIKALQERDIDVFGTLREMDDREILSDFEAIINGATTVDSIVLALRRLKQAGIDINGDDDLARAIRKMAKEVLSKEEYDSVIDVSSLY